jgi:predicted DNA-binding transcriptional regulator AlpA
MNDPKKKAKPGEKAKYKPTIPPHQVPDLQLSGLDPLLTAKDVRTVLAISRATQKRWGDEGRLPVPIRLRDDGRGCLRWYKSEIIAFLERFRALRGGEA